VLRSGRPQLVVPFAHDQPDNASRVERSGVAKVLYPRRYTGDRVAKHLEALLEEPGYVRRAGEVAERVRSEEGVEDACDALEEILK
jgi:UDP:flavonoid glycosyltransferase YjiC (YdhE family)